MLNFPCSGWPATSCNVVTCGRSSSSRISPLPAFPIHSDRKPVIMQRCSKLEIYDSTAREICLEKLDDMNTGHHPAFPGEDYLDVLFWLDPPGAASTLTRHQKDRSTYWFNRRAFTARLSGNPISVRCRNATSSTRSSSSSSSMAEIKERQGLSQAGFGVGMQHNSVFRPHQTCREEESEDAPMLTHTCHLPF